MHAGFRTCLHIFISQALCALLPVLEHRPAPVSASLVCRHSSPARLLPPLWPHLHAGFLAPACLSRLQLVRSYSAPTSLLCICLGLSRPYLARRHCARACLSQTHIGCKALCTCLPAAISDSAHLQNLSTCLPVLTSLACRLPCTSGCLPQPELVCVSSAPTSLLCICPGQPDWEGWESCATAGKTGRLGKNKPRKLDAWETGRLGNLGGKKMGDLTGDI